MAADGHAPRPPELEAAFDALPPPGADDYLDRLREAPVEVVVRSRREKRSGPGSTRCWWHASCS